MDQVNNVAYQGGLNLNGLAANNCYSPYPYSYPYGYPYELNYIPYYQPQYLSYPVYQTDPKVIELLEAIKQLLEKKNAR